MNEQMSLFPTRGETFEEGRQQFYKKLQNDGEAICPCCNRRGKVNKLKIHSTLAAMLCRLYRASIDQHDRPDGWVHLAQFKLEARSGNDFSIVKHWGIAESMPADFSEDKASSGNWRLTELGIQFVQREISIKRNLFVFDDQVILEGHEKINMIKSLNDKFSYLDLTGLYAGEAKDGEAQ